MHFYVVEAALRLKQLSVDISLTRMKNITKTSTSPFGHKGVLTINIAPKDFVNVHVEHEQHVEFTEHLIRTIPFLHNLQPSACCSLQRSTNNVFTFFMITLEKSSGEGKEVIDGPVGSTHILSSHCSMNVKGLRARNERHR